jgi:hypothetical protein
MQDRRYFDAANKAVEQLREESATRTDYRQACGQAFELLQLCVSAQGAMGYPMSAVDEAYLVLRQACFPERTPLSADGPSTSGAPHEGPARPIAGSPRGPRDADRPEADENDGDDQKAPRGHGVDR